MCQVADFVSLIVPKFEHFVVVRALNTAAFSACEPRTQTHVTQQCLNVSHLLTSRRTFMTCSVPVAIMVPVPYIGSIGCTVIAWVNDWVIDRRNEPTIGRRIFE